MYKRSDKEGRYISQEGILDSKMTGSPKSSKQQRNVKEENVRRSTADKKQEEATTKENQSIPLPPSSSPESSSKNKIVVSSDTKDEESLQESSKNLPEKPLPFVSDIASGDASSLKKRQAKRTPTPTKVKNDDPHKIVSRFVDNHLIFFPNALREIKSGAKRSCWMWFILPTPPHVVNGVERGSSMNRRFALRGDEAIDAYLSFKRWVPFPKDRYAAFYDPYSNPFGSSDDDDDEKEKEEGQVVDLRQNYVAMVSAVRKQLMRGNNMTSLFGPIDDVKAISSFKLFEKAGIRGKDDELSSLCREVLDFAESDLNSKKKRRKGPMLKYLSNRKGSS